MAAIVAGGSLGILQGSGGVLGGAGQLGAPAHGRAGERVYLNAATGNLVIQGQDEILIGRGPDGAFLRTYNSQGLLNDDNGDNWRLNFHRRVLGLSGTVNTAGSTVTRVDADGAEAVYAYDSALGKYVTTEGSGAFDTLSHSGSTWTWTDGDGGVTETYDAGNGGRLTAVTDGSGNSITFSYNGAGLLSAVQTANGETTYLDYAGSNLTRIRTVDSGGATLIRTSYAYDAANRLSSVTTDLTPENTSDAKTYVTSYTYDGASRRVATMTQSDGASLAFTYLQVGADYRVSQISQTVEGVQRVINVSYDTTARTTTVTDALGRTTVLAYDSSRRLTGITLPAAGGASQQVSYAYDASGNVASVTDAKGNAVVYGYDTSGNTIYERDAAGNVVERLYGAKNELLVETAYRTPDPDGAGSGQPSGALTTRYVYDASTRLRFVVGAAGRVVEHRYNGFGERVTTIEYTANAYDLTGLTAASTLTEAQLSAWVPAGTNLIRTDTTYDFRGQVASVTMDGAVTQYVYGQAGSLLQTIDPRSFQTSYAYDGLARVLSSTDALGRVTLTDYQDANRKTVITLANGLVRTSTYSAAGELISLLESTGGTNLGETRYFYDANGRLKRTEDPTGIKSHVFHDEVGRKVGEVDGDGSLTEYRYDANNNLTRTIRYATAVSTTIAEGATLASIRPAAHANDRSTWAVYDAANRLVKTVDAAGFVTQRFYDGAGRLTDTVMFATAIATAALGDTPAAAAVSANSSSGDRLAREFYDAEGKRLATLDGEGYLVEYKYDAAGQLVETIGYATATSAALRATGTLEQLRPAIAAGDVQTHRRYNARGQLAREIDAEGYLTEFVYDLAGNKTQEIRYATKVTGRAVTLPGTAGSALATPDSPANSVTGDVEFVARILPDSYTGAIQTIIAKRGSGGHSYSFRLGPSGELLLQRSRADGSAAFQMDAPVPLTYTSGVPLWVKGSIDIDNGAGYSVGHFWQSSDGVDWTYLGSGVNATYQGPIFDSTSDLEIGSSHNGASFRFAGKIFYADVRNGQNGAIVAKFDPANDAPAAAAGTLRAATGETWTLVGAATLGTLAGAQDQVATFTYDALNRTASETGPDGTVTQYTYDEVGNLIKSVKAANTADVRTLNAQYDKQGRLTAELSGNGSALLTGSQTQAEIDAIWASHAIKHAYDAAGRRKSTTDALGNRTLFYYDADGRLAYTVNALGEVKRSVYDALGELAQTIEYSSRLPAPVLAAAEGGLVSPVLENAIAVFAIPASNATVSYGYDAAGNRTRMTDALGNVETLTYNAFGELAARSQPIAAGQTLDHTYAYDRRGLLTHTFWDPAGLNTSTVSQYDAFGRAVQTIDARGGLHTRSYDKLGRVVETRDALNALRSSGYDAFGRVLEQTDALGKKTTFAYDNANRSITMITPEGVTVTTQSNPHGEKSSVTDGLGNETTYEYDRNGNLAGTTAPAGPVAHAYDRADRLIETLDARGTRTTYSYDAAGRMLTRVVDPGGLALTTRYAYDAKGRALSVFDANGVETRTEFDLKGQAVSVTVDPHGLALKSAYTYDRRGKTLTVTEGAGTAPARVTQYAYDALGRRISERVDPSGLNLTTTYAYDANDNVVSKTSAGGNVTRYVYDASNQLVYTVDPLGVVTRSEYDANGRVVRSTSYANAISAGTLPAQPMPANVAALLVADPARDRVSRVVRDDDGRAVYSINSLGAVTQSVYDANGNVVRKVVYAVAIPASTAATEAEVQAAVAGAQQQSSRFFYDAANRPIYAVDASGAVVESVYDANGNVLRTRAYATLAGTGEVTLAQLAALDESDADRVVRNVYDAANRRVFTIDAGNYVKETRYDNAGRVTQSIAYATAVELGAAPTVAQVQAALGITSLASYSNTTSSQNAAPVQPYAYLESARLDTAAPATQTVSVGSETVTVNSLQPHTYIGSAKSDSTGTATQNVSLSIQNTSVTQSGNVGNYAWYRGGDRYIHQTSGLSIIPGYVGYGDSTPSGVRATVYQNGSYVTQTYTDVGWQSTDAWTVYYPVMFDEAGNPYPQWDEAGNLNTPEWAARTAYGYRWNYVYNWGGQVNISYQWTLAPGRYQILLETWDSYQAGMAENAYYDQADGTWGTYQNWVTVDVGTVSNPTFVRWTMAQPAGTSSVAFKYRAAGSNGSYSTVGVGVNGSNLHEANLGIIAGNYEYIVEYRDSYGRLLRSASGTLTSSAGQTTSANAAFSYTTYSSSASAGSSIRYFTAASQWAPVNHVTATVKNASGSVVSTAVTYPEAESGYNGEVNLKLGAVLADGYYTIELTLHNKNGTTTTVTPFAYEVGPQRLKQTITWAASTQPAGTTASFKYRVPGSTGSWTSATIGSAGANHQVALDWINAGTYEYAVEYRDSYNRVLKSAAGTFAVTGPSGSSSTNVNFAYIAYSSTVAAAGSSISGYLTPAAVPGVERLEATVKTLAGATVSSALTYPAAEPGYAGNVNLSVGAPLANGRYNITVTVFGKDGTSSTSTFLYEVGPQDYARRTTSVSWSAASQPAGTTAEFVYKRAGQSGETVVTPTLASGSYSASFDFTADDGVQTGLAEGIYDFTVRYRNGAQVVLEGKGQFAAQAGGGGASTITFTPVAHQTETFAYDRAGRLIQTSDARGFAESHAYDAAGNRTSHTDARGFTTSYRYDAAGRASFTVDAAGYVTQRVHDGDGNVVKEVLYANALQGAVSSNPLSQITLDAAKDRVARSIYDGAGRKRYGVDGEGYVTERRFDAFGQETSRIRYASKLTVGDGATPASMAALLPATVPASAAKEDVSYDQGGRVVEVVDGEGTATRSGYDLFGNKTEVTRAYGTAAASTVRYTHDILGRVLEETRAHGAPEQAITRYELDTFGNQVRIIEARGAELAETDSAWALATRFDLILRDEAGNAKLASALTTGQKDWLRGLYATEQQFDVLGRRTRIIDPLGGVREMTYDAFGNTVKLVDPRGNAGFFYFDQRNQAVLSVDPEGYATRTFYDAAGNVERTVLHANRVSGTIDVGQQPVIVADAARDQVTVNEYDARNLKTRVTDAAGAFEQYTYNALGKKDSYRNKLGGLTSYAYDRVGNLVSETLPVGGIVHRFEYDARGNRTRQIEAFGLPEAHVTDYEYDKLDREVRKIRQAVHVFDPATNSAAGTATPIEEKKYDVRGNLIETIAANGARTLTYYDALDREIAELGPLGALIVWQHNAGKAPVAELRYGDPVALPASAGGVPPTPVNAANVREKRFFYDANERLVKTVVPGVTLGERPANSSDYALYEEAAPFTSSLYDAAGNEVRAIDPRGKSTFRYYDKLGQKVLEVDAGRYVTRWEYDAAGNVVKETKYATALTLTPAVTSSVGDLIDNVDGNSADRVTEFDYDRMNREVERRVLNVETGSVAGNTVSAASAHARTQLLYNGLGQIVRRIDATGAVSDITYDAAGRRTKEEGAQYVDYQGAGVRPTVDYEYDGLNQVKRELVRGKNGASEADDRITFYQYDYGFGARLLAQTSAHGAPEAATANFFYDVAGRIASRSMSRTNADGATVVDRTNYVYDLADREIRREVDGSAQVNETRYNVYGEVTGKRTNGGGPAGEWQEIAEYDKLGHVWKSNSGDGVFKVYLYDANGNATATIESAGPSFAQLSLDEVMALADDQKYLTITQFDARNKVTDIYQPLMNSGNHVTSIEQFITQRAGVQFSGGGVSVGLMGGVGTKPRVTSLVASSAGIRKASVLSATLTLRYTYQGEVTGLVNSPYSMLRVSVPNLNGTLGVGDYKALITLNGISGTSGAHLGGINTYLAAANGTELTFQFTEPGNWGYTHGEGGVINGFNAPFTRSYSYQLYKTVAGQPDVYLGSGSGTGAAPSYAQKVDENNQPVFDEDGEPVYEILPIGSPNLAIDNASTFAFGSNEVVFGGQFPTDPSAPQAARLILQYRVAGSNSGWSTLEAQKKFTGNSGRFAFDWTSLPPQSYEFRYTTLDSANQVINSQASVPGGEMVLNIPDPTIGQTVAREMNGAGRAFMAADGSLHIMEQGASAQTATVHYRRAGTNDPWARVDLGAASVNGIQTPGWFIFGTGGLSGDYEYYIEAKHTNGAGEVVQDNKARGTFTVGNAELVSPLEYYADGREMVHFTGQDLSAVTMKVSYRRSDSADPWSDAVLAQKVLNHPGAFDWDATGLVIDRFQDYDYEYRYETFDASYAMVNKAFGEITVGFNPAIVTEHENDMAPSEVRIRPPHANATKLVLEYRTDGTSDPFASATLTRASSEDAFIWNVSSLLTPGTTLSLEYSYELFDSADEAVLNPNGTAAHVNGVIEVGDATPARELAWVIVGSANDDWAIHRRQSHNAFGEVASEVDGRDNLTTFTYSKLGQLIEKKDPLTDITLANGFIDRAQPTTSYFYDLAGRLIATRDANGYVSTLALLPGSGLDEQAAKALTEFHADGGTKLVAYDVFGDAVRLTDEIGRVTLQEYDKLGRLTRIVRPSRAANSAGNETGAAVSAVDLFAYDQAGNRIRRTNALGAVEKTFYDGIGRVTKVTSYGGIDTTYAYEYQNSIAGVGGVQVGGWLKTTTEGTGHTLKDKQDVFGRLTWHEDLGGHTFDYFYNHAGWLTAQTGSTGQNITYEYFANGYLKKIKDLATHATSTYQYDAEGNRTLESYTREEGGSTQFYQHAVVQYDELNRVTRVVDETYDIRYEYDANGNRRRVWSYYHDGVDHSQRVQDFWYAYDEVNRFVLTMGRLSSGALINYDRTTGRAGSAESSAVSIVRGEAGVSLEYNRASERRVAHYAAASPGHPNGHSEQYTYTADGYLEETQIVGGARTLRYNDLLGRVVKYEEFDSSPTGRATNYDADGKILWQREYSGTVAGGTETNYTTYDYVDKAGTTNNAGALALTTSVTPGGPTNYTSYYYDYWDSAKERDILLQPYSQNAPGWLAGESHLEYDVNGHLKSLNDPYGGRAIRYVTDAAGRVLIRSEIAGQSANAQGVVEGSLNVFAFERFFYLNGRLIGDVGNDGPRKVSYAEDLARDKNISREDRYRNWRPISSADFDQNFERIGPSYPGTTSSLYTVSAGDTLPSIALAVWGDADMWYLIADANGLTGASALTEGQTLVIPNKVTNIHNTSETYRVYSAGAAIGDTAPTVPDAPPPPPRPRGRGCGAFNALVKMVVSVGVAILLPTPQNIKRAWDEVDFDVKAHLKAVVRAARKPTIKNSFMVVHTSPGMEKLEAAVVEQPALYMIGRTAATIVTSVFAGGPWGGAAWDAYFTWVATGSTTESVKTGAISLAASYAGGAASTAVGATYGTVAGAAAGAATSAVVSQGMEIALDRREKFDWRAIATQTVVAAGASYLGGGNGARGNLGQQIVTRAGFGVGSSVATAVLMGRRVNFRDTVLSELGSAALGSFAPSRSLAADLGGFDGRGIAEGMEVGWTSPPAASTGEYLDDSGHVVPRLIEQQRYDNEQAAALNRLYVEDPFVSSEYEPENVAAWGGDAQLRPVQRGSASPADVRRIENQIEADSLRELEPVRRAADEYNLERVRAAYAQGENLAPTIENGNRLGLLDRDTATVKDIQAATGYGVVNPAYMAASSVSGMLSSGLATVQGLAMTGTGILLAGMPEPTTLSKWAGFPLMVFGGLTTGKSIMDFGLNASNFGTALQGSYLEANYMPGSALEAGVRYFGGSPEAEKGALAVDLAWSLASGRVLDTPLRTGHVLGQGQAYLLSPMRTTVNAEALWRAPQFWQFTQQATRYSTVVDLGFQMKDNVWTPLRGE